jgi:hypothetical protein
VKPRTHLALEQLEDRWCPAVTASLSAGTLTISGSADNGSIRVAQDETTAGTIQVLDGTTAVSNSPFTGVTSIKLNLTAADDTVTIDLGGLALPGNVTANLGTGTDSLTVLNGTIAGRLSVAADAAASGGHGPWGGNHWGSGASTPDTGPDTVTLAAGATANNVSLRAGQAGGTIEIAGDVTADLANVTGEVDGNVRFSGSDQGDTLNIDGDIGKSVLALTGSGADKVSITGAVTKGLALGTGSGDDLITLSSVVGGKAFISAGAGNDALTITDTAKFLSTTLVSMGAGIDTVTLDDAATIATMLINGGTGTDTFVGTPSRTGLTLVSF